VYPAVNVLYFGQFNPPLFTLPYYPLFSSSPSTDVHMVTSSPSTDVKYSDIVDYHLFSFPSSLKFHSVTPLLLTCSTLQMVYDYVVFVYTFIFWIYLPHMTENMGPLSFRTWLVVFFFLFFFLWDWNLNSGQLYPLSYTSSSFCSGYFWKGELLELLPGLASNPDPLDLSLPSS
jgi:hypothetical protein